MKASRHNGRSGSHGAYNPKHNDREFDLEKAEEIQKELTRNNIYWDCIQREAVRHEDRGEGFASFTEVEKGFYDLVYKDYVEGQNARNNAARHSERNRTTDDLRENPKTCPEETIYQIGNIDKHVDYDVLVKVTFDFLNELQEKYGSHMHILDWALHLDEGTPHIHERHVFDVVNKYGERQPKQEEALKELGFELPDPEKKSGYDRFALADQEGMLLMVDDDMKMEALADTGVIKAVVTMEDKMNLERKGQQSYQGYLYVRIMAFGNGALSSLYDKSDGFYRRQITIKVKDKPDGRIDDRNLSEKLAKETEGIALWCLEGLKRLVANEFHFTVSDRTVQNQAEMRKDEDSIMDFFESEGYVTFDADAICTTKDLYEAYMLWAEGNAIKPRSESSFSREVKQRAGKLGIEYLKNAAIDGKTARGYKGIYANHVIKDVPFENKKSA